eukprot:CAMPEP_0175121548 /NCGR_PEP_ID=MMETSP0087-20121206/1222_1 /TAXON_ID=136419 /ORGANISM="Unknown Unknown, Strain D1" /LENGTH=544 /DNA_ID=CAMNT_0016403087 /DNA_START=37 /DNA_END=1668 /DNA_ORIENTATION=+
MLAVLLILALNQLHARKNVYTPVTSLAEALAKAKSSDFDAFDPKKAPKEWGPDIAVSHKVNHLPFLPFNYSHAMYAGTVSVNEPLLNNNGSLFYWLVESQNSPHTSPLLIWLNGGPGCSSTEGLLIENGPFLSSESGLGLQLNPHSWNTRANVLYIDQPVGVGFSSVKDGAYAMSQKEIDIMFMAFLRRFYSMFPHYSKVPLYISGESYAGRYIPRFAAAVLRDTHFPARLEGVLIGNGWTFPIVQSRTLPAYAFAHGIISKEQKDELDEVVRECELAYNRDPYSTHTYNVCELIQTAIPRMSGSSQIGTMNVYDIRLYDTSGGADWPWRSSGEVAFLNNPLVRKALHVETSRTWVECSDLIGQQLTHEDMWPTVDEFLYLLPRTQVLLYNGQFDFICNHFGVENFLEEIEWVGKSNFSNPSRRGLWAVDSQLAGYAKQGGNLTYLLFLGGSHMVPMDKRPESLDMLTRFFAKQSFFDIVEAPSHFFSKGKAPAKAAESLLVQTAAQTAGQGEGEGGGGGGGEQEGVVGSNSSSSSSVASLLVW